MESYTAVLSTIKSGRYKGLEEPWGVRRQGEVRPEELNLAECGWASQWTGEWGLKG